MPDIVLDGPADFAGWRNAARALAAKGVPPSDVVWRTDAATADLFESPFIAADAKDAVLAVPRSFVELAGQAALHRDEDRFVLLYRLLWRLRAERRLMEMASDPDVSRMGLLARAVRRDIHKMHAFVRFRAVTQGEDEHYAAWYEPDNHIVEAATPFFMRRFATMRWTILTPERSADWDRSNLVFGPGASIHDAPAEDMMEELWREYYASIFNPARLNPEQMRAEMPKRFWKNLPEAQLIRPLMAEAVARAQDMVAAPPTEPVVRKGAAAPAHKPTPAAEGLEGVRAAAMVCRDCPLWAPATQTVFGEGPDKARIMLVGEQPGDVEDIKGRPFVGPAGQLLDRALAEAGLDRTQAYVTNAVKHFKFVPRGKRRIHQKPNSTEIRACNQWLEQELALVDPPLIVAMGATAAQGIFGKAMPIGKNRGQVLEHEGRRVIITVHPSYLLRLPDEEAKHREYAAFVEDLRLARAKLR
ncbi:MAG TPA: UdgX family uracil-DNA binding protein [Alphaproteobacteria bacterium]|nr:UdgX family uracil-DNA binding protein [Alphaproteobacteria bacterium]